MPIHAGRTSAQKMTQTQALDGDGRPVLVVVPSRLQEDDVELHAVMCFHLGACTAGYADGERCIVNGLGICRPAENGNHTLRPE